MSEENQRCGLRVVRILLGLCLPVGLLLSAVTRLMDDTMPDFWSGFCLGTSAMFMIIGIAYFGWCLGKRRSPYDFRN